MSNRVDETLRCHSIGERPCLCQTHRRRKADSNRWSRSRTDGWFGPAVVDLTLVFSENKLHHSQAGTGSLNPACSSGESANQHHDRLMAEVAARIFGSSGSRADACRRLTGIAIDRPYLKGDQAAKLRLGKAGDAMPLPSDGLSWNWPALGAPVNS